ncbi:hypothetical protein ABW20_dc0110513 [Dactylellina cionopaga]|nr:hypothetical protein ABW20_dc0110513 [Dactylellina cionopaga]
MPRDANLDIVLFGATGFTGWIAAQYISKYGPKELQWAIAGRSQDKLNGKLRELRGLFPDRSLPVTIVADLDDVSAIKLAGSAKVVISTVGPYCRYGSGLVKACAEAGTHYTDCTGEHPWVLDMVKKHHETAKRTGAIIVPQTAFESAPADLVSYKIASLIREKYNTGTKDVTFSLHNLNGGASGGTIETFFSVIETYGLSELARSSKALALSPIRRKYFAPRHGPVHTNPILGTLTPWLQGTADRAIVMRSWGLTQEAAPQRSWGDNFSFTEYKRVNSYLEGIVTWLTIGVLSISVLFSPFRWIARKVVMQPGSGPDQNFDKAARGSLEWRAVGVVDSEEEGNGKGKKVLGSFTFDNGEAYALTALSIVEAAFAILDLQNGKGVDDDCLAKTIGGGILTPSCLGETYLKRLDEVGIKIDAKVL